jgi:hypothetical protein
MGLHSSQALYRLALLFWLSSYGGKVQRLFCACYDQYSIFPVMNGRGVECSWRPYYLQVPMYTQSIRVCAIHAAHQSNAYAQPPFIVHSNYPRVKSASLYREAK